MATWIPEGWHSVTPRLVARDVAGLVEFLKRAFGAAGDLRTDRPCQMRIGDSLVMVSGAVSLEAPADTPYGDRRAMVADPFDNVWQIATHKSG